MKTVGSPLAGTSIGRWLKLITVSILMRLDVYKRQVQGELDAARLALDALHRIQHLEGPAVAVVHPLRLDRRDVLVIFVYNAGAGGDTCGVSEGDVDGIVVHPGLVPNSDLLLPVLLAVNGDLCLLYTSRCV